MAADGNGGAVRTIQSNTLDFYFSFGLGLSAAIAVIGLWHIVTRLLIKREGEREFNWRALFRPPAGRGDFSIWIALGIYILVTGGTILLACALLSKAHASGVGSPVTKTLIDHPLVTLERGEIAGLPPEDWDNVIVATGPLTSAALAQAILEKTGEDQLAFFDAIAPIVHRDSIDMSKAWFQSRYDKQGPGGTGADCSGSDFAFPARARMCEASTSAVRLPSRNAAIQPTKDLAAVSISSSTAGEAGRFSSSQRLSTCSTSQPASPRSIRPTMRPLPFSV